MVWRGQVDDDLESETAEECSRYGVVQRCMIYEILSASVPDSEAVRIFVNFETKDAALKGLEFCPSCIFLAHQHPFSCFGYFSALNALDGRFFGGRQVHASFYDINKFRNNDLNS